MAENKHTISDLYQMQSLPLRAKIQMTRQRIRGWIDEYGEDGVYVSFSGGKDSTVLLDIVRKDYPRVKAVFVDTGLEYPEIREFVRGYDNVDWIKSKMNFRQVIEKYGYPFISKEVSECVHGARKYLKSIAEGAEQRYKYRYDKLCGRGVYAQDEQGGGQTTGGVNYEELENTVLTDKSANVRIKMVLGLFTKRNQTMTENTPSVDMSRYNCERYKFFLDAPFEISNICCKVMKKEPAHRYGREAKRKPITAQMASESRLRTQKWLQYGCNAFDSKNPISNPMSFWTEQDVLLYIQENNLPICSVYGDIVTDYAAMGQYDNQMSLADFGLENSRQGLAED